MTMKDYIKEWNEDRERELTIVSSDEYRQWLYENITSSMYDDEFLYQQDNPNHENAQLLSSFYDYVDSKYEEQNLMIPFSELNPMISFSDAKKMVHDNSLGWENILLNFKIKGAFFSIQTEWGQGSMTTVTRLDNEPSYYVEL